MSVVPVQDDDADIQQLEDLLETYFTQVDNSFNKLQVCHLSDISVVFLPCILGFCRQMWSSEGPRDVRELCVCWASILMADRQSIDCVCGTQHRPHRCWSST